MSNIENWQSDKKWLEFDKKILNSLSESFENVITNLYLDDYLIWLSDENKQIGMQKWKNDWTYWSNKWSSDKPIPLFAGMAYGYVLIPFEHINRDKFNLDDFNMINMFRNYYGIPQIIDANQKIEEFNYAEHGPMHPGAFQEWMDDLHNRVTWRINYNTYVRSIN